MPLHFIISNYDSLVLIIQIERRWFGFGVGFLNSWMCINKVCITYCTLKANRLSEVTVGLQRLHSIRSG